MNWKVLCLIPSLTLAAVPAYSNTIRNNQTAPSAVIVAQSDQQGGAMMKKPGAMTHDDGAMMKKPGAMTHDGAMMNNGAMMKHGAMMGMGSRGEAVKSAQSFLKREGFYTGSINGIFDGQTHSAVMKFQKSKGLRPDGMIGPRTQAAMK